MRKIRCWNFLKMTDASLPKNSCSTYDLCNAYYVIRPSFLATRDINIQYVYSNILDVAHFSQVRSRRNTLIEN